MKKFVSVFLIVIAAGILASCAAPAQEAPSATPTPAPSATVTPAAAQTTEAPEKTAAQSAAPMGPVTVKLNIAEAYPNLKFERPLYFTVAGDGSGDAYVVEQTGKIKVFSDSADAADAGVFLDLSGKVSTDGNEKGLLGLAFHPDYKNNGYLYVDYTDSKGTVIARYTRRADNPKEADTASEQVLLTFPQPYANHNGGQLVFGPDGYLYIGTGDGGSGGDPQNNAQNASSYLGKILRIDVDHPSGGKAYGIPEDNPYAGNVKGQLEEIYALGMRNPWRFSFDANGTFWVADVGQDTMEEIDQVISGGNYGWSVMEGTLPYKDVPGADTAAMIPPIWEYRHDQGESVTGGYVYAGSAIPDLKGRYIYGDFISGRIWALWLDADGNAQNELLLESGLRISSFGLDADGGLRIVDLGGKVYRLEIFG